MPYVSRAQAGYFHTHKAQLERQGVDVGEWDAATKGKSLPEHANMATNKVELGKKSFNVQEGSLHKLLGIPEGDKIGEERLHKAAHSSNPSIRRKAVSGIGLSHMHHKG